MRRAMGAAVYVVLVGTKSACNKMAGVKEHRIDVQLCVLLALGKMICASDVGCLAVTGTWWRRATGACCMLR